MAVIIIGQNLIPADIEGAEGDFLVRHPRDEFRVNQILLFFAGKIAAHNKRELRAVKPDPLGFILGGGFQISQQVDIREEFDPGPVFRKSFLFERIFQLRGTAFFRFLRLKGLDHIGLGIDIDVPLLRVEHDFCPRT